MSTKIFVRERRKVEKGEKKTPLSGLRRQRRRFKAVCQTYPQKRTESDQRCHRRRDYHA